MTDQTFRLYWPREGSAATGGHIVWGDLPAEIRDQAAGLAGDEPGEFEVRLPFLDRKESRREAETLRGLRLMREDHVIRAVLGPQAAARDLAARCVFRDRLWREAPTERDVEYFAAWQGVSIALQQWFRKRVAEACLDDTARLADRPASYPVIVYQASRLCHGRARTEFTYDLRDYPECDTTLEASWKMTGRAIRLVLSRIERRLLDAGMTELAHRYAPIWHQDVLVSVQKKPKPYVELLMAEAAVINAVIDLGTERSVAAANRFAAAVNLNLRRIANVDLRGLGVGVLEEATRVLVLAGLEAPRGLKPALHGLEDLIDGGVFEDGDAGAARSPDTGVGGQKNGDHGSAHGGGQVSDPGIVADVDAGGGQPAGQVV
jgi:hypothetical protein